MDSQEKPTKKFYKQWWFWVIVVLVLAVIGESGGSKTSDQTTAQTEAVPTTQSAPAETASAPAQTAAAPAKQTAPAKTTTASVPAPASAPASAPHVPVVLLQVSGNGQKSTQTFTAPSNWTMDYTYDCSSFGMRGNFQVYVYNANGTMALLSGPNELGTSGSDTEYYHQGGQFYLEVNSECSWTITAKG